ncbi:hypothetical protein V1477_010295 [Vespula maculifrons]|uniref:Uncharacterized protein n=1 Tax=Vespula maculifrons TaxID=7453 RepID=A0ABD2C853_VESMC
MLASMKQIFVYRKVDIFFIKHYNNMHIKSALAVFVYTVQMRLEGRGINILNRSIWYNDVIFRDVFWEKNILNFLIFSSNKNIDVFQTLIRLFNQQTILFY